MREKFPFFISVAVIYYDLLKYLPMRRRRRSAGGGQDGDWVEKFLFICKFLFSHLQMSFRCRICGVKHCECLDFVVLGRFVLFGNVNFFILLL